MIPMKHYSNGEIAMSSINIMETQFSSCREYSSVLCVLAVQHEITRHKLLVNSER